MGCGAGSPVGETGCLAQLVVAGFGVLVGDGSPQKAWGPGLGGRDVLPNRWLHASERQWGMITPKRRRVTGWEDKVFSPGGGCRFRGANGG